eukprot:TRINITY_DN16409_c0_g2_i1.p1 TRINITY_DN16409_c0_g2~~TRINITY_DN16409_c0_g2_i1.p1  ORF type:complete len:863 (+),score=288.36 TRINITY_DN16409_c0_g2_i1:81-2669(+)
MLRRWARAAAGSEGWAQAIGGSGSAGGWTGEQAAPDLGAAAPTRASQQGEWVQRLDAASDYCGHAAALRTAVCRASPETVQQHRHAMVSFGLEMMYTADRAAFKPAHIRSLLVSFTIATAVTRGLLGFVAADPDCEQYSPQEAAQVMWAFAVSPEGARRNVRWLRRLAEVPSRPDGSVRNAADALAAVTVLRLSAQWTDLALRYVRKVHEAAEWGPDALPSSLSTSAAGCCVLLLSTGDTAAGDCLRHLVHLCTRPPGPWGAATPRTGRQWGVLMAAACQLRAEAGPLLGLFAQRLLKFAGSMTTGVATSATTALVRTVAVLPPRLRGDVGVRDGVARAATWHSTAKGAGPASAQRLLWAAATARAAVPPSALAALCGHVASSLRGIHEEQKLVTVAESIVFTGAHKTPVGARTLRAAVQRVSDGVGDFTGRHLARLCSVLARSTHVAGSHMQIGRAIESMAAGEQLSLADSGLLLSSLPRMLLPWAVRAAAAVAAAAARQVRGLGADPSDPEKVAALLAGAAADSSAVDGLSGVFPRCASMLASAPSDSVSLQSSAGALLFAAEMRDTAAAGEHFPALAALVHRSIRADPELSSGIAYRSLGAVCSALRRLERDHDGPGDVLRGLLEAMLGLWKDLGGVPLRTLPLALLLFKRRAERLMPAFTSAVRPRLGGSSTDASAGLTALAQVKHVPAQLIADLNERVAESADCSVLASAVRANAILRTACADLLTAATTAICSPAASLSPSAIRAVVWSQDLLGYSISDAGREALLRLLLERVFDPDEVAAERWRLVMPAPQVLYMSGQDGNKLHHVFSAERSDPSCLELLVRGYEQDGHTDGQSALHREQLDGDQVEEAARSSVW